MGLRVHRSAKPDGPPLGFGTLTLKVDEHFFIHASKKEQRQAKNDGREEPKYIAFNKSECTQNSADTTYRYKAPLPEGAKTGELIEINLKDSEPMTAKDFIYELENDLEHHPGNMADPWALLLILLFFGPFVIVVYQTTMFAQDLGVRGPESVKGGDLFKLTPIDNIGDVRGPNPARDRWEQEIASAWRDGNRPESIWDEPYKGDLRSDFQKAPPACSRWDLAFPVTTVKPVDASGTPLPTFESDAVVQGTYCVTNMFFAIVLLMFPILLIGGFVHMTCCWRKDLRSYVKSAIKRELSDAAKAVQIDEATQGDRFGIRSISKSEGDWKGMIGGQNAYHTGWMKRNRKLGDVDGDGNVDTNLTEKHGPIFFFKKLHYKMKTSPEELMLYTEAQEIFLALFSVYRFTKLGIENVYGIELVLLVAFCQCLISPTLLLSKKPSLCIVAVTVFDMFVDFFYASMALSRSRSVFGARDRCIHMEWTSHPCNSIFDEWTFFDVFLTFYSCIFPPLLFARKVVRQHTFIAWKNFKFYFDRTGSSRAAMQDKQLDKLLHWSSRNIILLPGHHRDAFLSRVKCFYSLGLLGTFALWWYIQLVPTRELCEDSSALFRAVPQDFRTGDPYLDDSVATCTGYMAYGVDLFGAVYNNTICTANFTLIEHNYITYRKMCPRVCGTCDDKISLMATELADARTSTLIVTIVLAFFVAITIMICRTTAVGLTCSAWLESWENNDDSLEQWKAVRDMTDSQIETEVARDQLTLDQQNSDLKKIRDATVVINPLEEVESGEVQMTGRADKAGHYSDEDDDI